MPKSEDSVVHEKGPIFSKVGPLSECDSIWGSDKIEEEATFYYD